MGQKRKSKSRPTRVEKPIEDSEDYCFVCKDGGELILCDHKDCIKAYHPGCVGKQLSDDSEGQWICGWHSCCRCSKTSSFRCICCQKAVCKRCIINNKEFAKLKGAYGICDECLKLATMVEEEKKVDSDGEEVDFNDRESVEGLFKEYWEIMRDKENLSWKDLNTAKGYMVNGYAGETKTSSPNKSHSESDEYGPTEIHEEDSDRGCDSHAAPKKYKPAKKGSRTKKQKRKERVFLGWGSKLLIDFLVSIGVDTSQKRSQDDVANIMINYAREKQLFDSEKKKKINCDAAMQNVLGRKSMTIYKIKDFLESHLLENIDYSDEDEQGYSSDEEDQNCLLSPKTLKKHRTSTTCREKDSPSKKLEAEDAINKGCSEDNASPVVSYSSPFASIVPDNLKLVYLRRSLVEELAEKPETFYQKVMGSFVKFKSSAAADYKRRYQLLPVIDIVKPADGNKTNIVMKLSGLNDDVLISMLADDDFSKEECDELRQKVEDGIIERPTVIDLQEKVRILHEDITKHSMARELIVLQHRIDLANEKGRRDLFYQCIQRRKLLQTPEEQVRRLRMVPEVTADIITDSKPVSKDSVQDDPSKL